MESERKIEKWLRNYAKKRRSQAGESFKLDAATRRILQNEVSRNAPPDEDDGTMSLWEVLRQQWAFFLGFAACIFLLATLFFRSVGTAMKKEAMTGTPAANHPQEISESAQVPAGTRKSISTLDHLAPGTNAPEIALADRMMTPPRAASPPASTGGEYAFAPKPEGMPQTITAGASQPQTFAAEGQFEARPESKFRNTLETPAQASPVLMNFNISQNGNTIRVMDQDGSIYTGRLQAERRAVANGIEEGPKAALPPTPQNASTAELGKPASPALSSVAAPQAPDYSLYSFRVHGINRTLKQSVVFSGTLLEDLEMAKNVQMTFGPSANLAFSAGYAQSLMKLESTNQTPPLPWSKLRIVGTAVVDHTNQIQINATPVPSLKADAPR